MESTPKWIKDTLELTLESNMCWPDVMCFNRNIHMSLSGSIKRPEQDARNDVVALLTWNLT